MMTSHSNAVLESHTDRAEAEPNSLRLADDVKRGYSKCPTAHVRDLVADGITGNGLAVYFAIADRQRIREGEYFRSNERLAEETGVSVRTVQAWISKLKKSGYLSIWYVNGGRRMRVLTRVRAVAPQHATTRTPPCEQSHPYKENNIKKTTQQLCVSLDHLSEKHRALFGEGALTKLVATFSLERVERGLLAWETGDTSDVRNPIGWLTRAIKDEWKPRKAKRVSEKFTESDYDHRKIIREYIDGTPLKRDTVAALISEGLAIGRIAHRIWVGKI